VTITTIKQIIIMKKILLSLITVLTFTFITNAQTISEGYVKMEFTDASSEDEQMAMGLGMIKGSTIEISFADGKSLASMDMMGGMIKVNALSDPKNDKSDMFMDAMGSKIWVESTISETKNQSKEANAEAEITYDKSDTKEIFGYKAYKFSIKPADGENLVLTGYATSEIKLNSDAIPQMKGFNFDGFPLEMTISNPQMKITIVTTDLQKSVAEGAFDINTEGYQKMSMKEFSESLGGLGSGFGF